MSVVLVTGSEGNIGRAMRTRLARPGRVLRLLDLVPPGPGAGVEPHPGSFSDPDVAAAACAGVDAVLHLGGIPTEAPWAEILATNVDGTRVLLDAAVAAGVPRVVLASSIHAAGMAPVPPAGGLPAGTPMRPDTFYGAGKVMVEALGSLYAERHGLDVTSVRIGTCFPRPHSVRDLSTWLSYDDCARLVEACLVRPGPPAHRIVWGVSANTRGVLSLTEGAAIGYHPRDDAEAFAADVPAGGPEPLLGGAFTRFELGVRR